jgi:hypothetical protein
MGTHLHIPLILSRLAAAFFRNIDAQPGMCVLGLRIGTGITNRYRHYKLTLLISDIVLNTRKSVVPKK